MSDPLPEMPPATEPPVEPIVAEPPAEPPAAAPARRRRDPLPFLIILGILVLCGAAVFLWRHPLGGAHLADQRKPVDAAEPASQPPPPAPMQTAAPAPPPPADSAQQAQIATLAQQVAALTQQTASLAARVEALEGRPAPSAAPDQALAGQVSDLAGRQASDSRSLSALTSQVASLKAGIDGFTATAARTARIARIEAAQAALALGQPLGPIDGAPPAIARYGTAAPPTEAALRLQFPALAAAAEAASRPRTDTLPFWQAVKMKAEQLVLIRRGDRVLVGDPDAGIIARAEAAVSAGDLPAALAALDGLQGPPAAILADWMARAANLLAAQKALAAMAASNGAASN